MNRTIRPSVPLKKQPPRSGSVRSNFRSDVRDKIPVSRVSRLLERRRSNVVDGDNRAVDVISRLDVYAEIGNTVPDGSSVNRFAPDIAPPPPHLFLSHFLYSLSISSSHRPGGSNGAVGDRSGERGWKMRGGRASGSGLTRWPSQGWAHDQILSLIWRRFTQKSPSFPFRSAAALSLFLFLAA